MENIVETGRALSLGQPFPILEVVNFPGFVMRWAPEVACGGYLQVIKEPCGDLTSSMAQSASHSSAASECASKDVQ